MKDKTPRECKECKHQYIPRRKWQEFCKPHCRDTWHNRIKKEKAIKE